jgi:hypothetical protein
MRFLILGEKVTIYQNMVMIMMSVTLTATMKMICPNLLIASLRGGNVNLKRRNAGLKEAIRVC